MRIASLLPSATEIVALLGRQTDLVAISHECDFPASVTHLPRVTRSMIDSAQSSEQIDRQVRQRMTSGESLYELDAERLDQCRPDIILTQSQCDVCAIRPEDVRRAIQQSAHLQSTEMVTLAPQTLSQTLADIERVGAAIGAESAAQQAASGLKQRVHAVQDLCQRSATWKPRVACLEWTEPMMAAGNWNPELFQRAGCEYGLAETGKHSPAISWDELYAFDPEVVIVAPCGFGLLRSQREAEQWRTHPRAASLNASQQNRVFAIDGNALLNRSGPRLVETLETIAALIHPQLFSPPPKEFAVLVGSSVP